MAGTLPFALSGTLTKRLFLQKRGNKMKRISVVLFSAVLLISGCSSNTWTNNTASSNAKPTAVSSKTDAEETENTDDFISSQNESDSRKTYDIPKIELFGETAVCFLDEYYADKINIYIIHENENASERSLVFSGSGNTVENGILKFDENTVLQSETIEAILKNIQCSYHAKAIQVGFFYDGAEEIVSDPIFAEVMIDTGVAEQNLLDFHGSTACGAASGTLLLQSVYPVYGDEILQRMNGVRNYSAISEDFSTGQPDYYMSGTQIANSVNKYAEEHGLEGVKLSNFRRDKDTAETLTELISDGKPAILEVCYSDGTITEDFRGYSHWIAVNGFTRTDEGVEFRCENTIGCKQIYISDKALSLSNENVVYPNSEYIPDRFILANED